VPSWSATVSATLARCSATTYSVPQAGQVTAADPSGAVSVSPQGPVTGDSQACRERISVQET
jgi:hypothetical protein